MKRSLIPILVLLMSCRNTPENISSKNGSLHIDNVPDNLVRDVYSGVLPCDDCEGVVTSLELVHEANKTSGSYSLKETYKGKPEGRNIFTGKGTWSTLRGDAVNKDAVVIEIKQGDASRYFLYTDDGRLHQLDKNMARIKDDSSHTLERKH